ncbi:MAG: T9SS type A sorting domain-containing protein [Rhodothermales bacterium]|nr:T9SS type A sorting domain-containing protein [Rhodothermales bacterium]
MANKTEAMIKGLHHCRVALAPVSIRILLVLGVANSCLFQESAGQDCPYPDSVAVVDTLSATMYQPLAVGNIWEYLVTDGDSLISAERSEIVGYAYFKNIFYYRLDSRYYHAPGDSVLSLDTLITDYIYVTDSSLVVNGSIGPRQKDIVFSASFQSCYSGFLASETTDLILVEGQIRDSVSFTVDGMLQPVEVAATKKFSVVSDTSVVFAHGIGMVEATGQLTTTLVFAQIDGVDFGTPLASLYVIPTSIETLETATGRPGIFPLPAGDTINLTIASVKSGISDIVVYDNLGRVVYQGVVPPDVFQIRIDVSTWAAGLYMLSVVDSGTTVSSPIVVVR